MLLRQSEKHFKGMGRIREGIYIAIEHRASVCYVRKNKERFFRRDIQAVDYNSEISSESESIQEKRHRISERGLRIKVVDSIGLMIVVIELN